MFITMKSQIKEAENKVRHGKDRARETDIGKERDRLRDWKNDKEGPER